MTCIGLVDCSRNDFVLGKSLSVHVGKAGSLKGFNGPCMGRKTEVEKSHLEGSEFKEHVAGTLAYH